MGSAFLQPPAIMTLPLWKTAIEIFRQLNLPSPLPFPLHFYSPLHFDSLLSDEHMHNPSLLLPSVSVL